VARARGFFPYDDCTPDCATGHTTLYPARITLSRPKLCAGKYRYLTLRYRVVGPRVPPYGGRRGGDRLDFVCRT
jgi:hypothetical protein